MRKITRSASCLLAAALGFTPALADPPQARSRTVDGMTIHIGVAPRANAQMKHAGSRLGCCTQHLVATLVDSRTGMRIEDAQVNASVAAYGLTAEPKRLEPMEIAGTITYGNHFAMSTPGPYSITLKIRRPGMAAVSTARFDYRAD